MCLAIPRVMNALLAAPLGVAAALVSNAADAMVQPQDVPEAEPLVPPAVELAAELAAEPAAPRPLPLVPPESSEAATSAEADPAPLCDEKCKFVELTKAILPNTPVPDLVSVALQPDKLALTIPDDEGDPALTIKLDPTKIARGKAVVATAKF